MIKVVFTLKNLPGAFTEILPTDKTDMPTVKKLLQEIVDHCPATAGRKVGRITFIGAHA